MYAIRSYYATVSVLANRQSSLNGHQAVLDPDGVFRAVISARDPGVPNWLDTGGVITSYSIHYTKLYDAMGVDHALRVRGGARGVADHGDQLT